jgi:hypothetical protein
LQEHLSRLVTSIDTNIQLAHSVFEPGFQSLNGWIAYWNTRNRGVTALFQKPGERWEPADFHRLFIACWLHRPVEKGSFLIPLTDPRHRQTVSAAMERLPSRWSSHMSKTGARTAGAGFGFLKGYHELLVQYEELNAACPSLFLKGEGHSSISFAHLSSYITKKLTGEGNMVNEALHASAASGRDGIALRAAENYDNSYEALLEYLGMKGTTHTVEEVLPVICAKLRTKASLVEEEYCSRVMREIGGGRRVSKADLAALIWGVILPTVDQVKEGAGKFVTKVKEAKESLDRIAFALDEDGGDVVTAAVPRVFQEVRVTFDQLDTTVERFLTEAESWLLL